MKKKKKLNRQKRMEKKRAAVNRRKKHRDQRCRGEWITGASFDLDFNDKNIRALFPSITVESVEDEEFPFGNDPDALDIID
ncbi:MAG: hypothetical protein JW969_13075 [Spirochaetales bacterium]|nr:hypothetical protein [Spirochaetales bacterium]